MYSFKKSGCASMKLRGHLKTVYTAGGSKLVPENLRVLEARFSFCGPSSFLQMKLQTWLIGG